MYWSDLSMFGTLPLLSLLTPCLSLYFCPAETWTWRHICWWRNHGWARLLCQTGGEAPCDCPPCPGVSGTGGRTAGGTCWPVRSPPGRATAGPPVSGTTTSSGNERRSFASAGPGTSLLQSWDYLVIIICLELVNKTDWPFTQPRTNAFEELRQSTCTIMKPMVKGN